LIVWTCETNNILKLQNRLSTFLVRTKG
jgi:hypothetical protein